MEHEVLRIGSVAFVNESVLAKTPGFDALFSTFNYEFVYIHDYDPWARVNGTWKGALAHILNGK